MKIVRLLVCGLIFFMAGKTNAQVSTRFVTDNEATIKIMLSNTINEAELKELKALLYAKRGFVFTWSNLKMENGKAKSLTISVDCNDQKFRGTTTIEDFTDKKKIGFYRHYSDDLPAPFWIGVE
ncbi:MAG TPA: hypothetical protein VK590_03245 [Saprospiraceae bacterium]|nr:hypothetical protein [Saprospiraceae bacterium]